MKRGGGVILALLILAFPAVAAEPGVTLTTITSAEASLTGNFSVRPALDARVDGPLAGLGSLRFVGRLRVFGLPGASISLADVETFRAGELSLAVYQRIGRRRIGQQEVWTSLVFEGGLASVRSAGMYPKHYTAGVRLEERASGMWLSLTGGRHEAIGPWGKGQVVIAAEVPLPGTFGIGVLGGDVIANIGPGHHDWRLYVGASLGKALQVIAGH